MEFRKHNARYEGNSFRPSSGYNGGKSLLHVDLRSQKIAGLTVTASFGIVVFLLFGCRMQIHLEQSDIQNIVSAMLAVSGLCFAIPVFLKEVSQENIFWQKFFVAAIISFLSTVIGVYLFLLIRESQFYIIRLAAVQAVPI